MLTSAFCLCLLVPVLAGPGLDTTCSNIVPSTSLLQAARVETHFTLDSIALQHANQPEEKHKKFISDRFNQISLVQMSASSAHELSSMQTGTHFSPKLRQYLFMDQMESEEHTEGPLVHWFTLCNVVGSIVGVWLLLCLNCLMSSLASNKEQQTETTMTAAVAATAAAAAPRSCLLDNARGFAATMVVFVHLTGYFMAQLVARHEVPTGRAGERTPDVDSWLSGCQLRDGILGLDLQSWFMTAARQFDMPIFCFVSGLCSQGATTRKRVVSFIIAVIAPWLLFRLVAEPLLYNPLRDLSLYNLRDFGNPHPIYDDWYMLALIVWKTVTLCCSKLGPYKLALCMIMSSFAFEYVDLSVPWAPFAFTRTFKFLPYYAVGYVWPRESILKLPTLSSLSFRDKVCVYCFLLFGALMMIPLFMDVFGTDFSDTFVSAQQFEGMQTDFLLAWVEIIARVSKNLLVMIPVLSFVIPKEQTIFTSIGRLTLYPYFLHRILLEHRLNFMVNANPPVWTSNFAHIMVYLGHYAFCVIVCLLLTSDPFRTLFGWAIEPKWLETLLEQLLPSDVGKRKSTSDHPPATTEAKSSYEKEAVI